MTKILLIQDKFQLKFENEKQKVTVREIVSDRQTDYNISGYLAMKQLSNYDELNFHSDSKMCNSLIGIDDFYDTPKFLPPKIFNNISQPPITSISLKAEKSSNLRLRIKRIFSKSNKKQNAGKNMTLFANENDCEKTESKVKTIIAILNRNGKLHHLCGIPKM